MYAIAQANMTPAIHSRAIAGRGITQPRPLSYFGPDKEIYGQGEKSGTIFLVEFGAVRLHRLLSDGRRQIVAFYLAGETFGFESAATRSFFAEAMVSTGVTVVQRQRPDLPSQELMDLALEGMVRAQEHLLVIGRQSAAERVAAFLVDMADRQGDARHVELPMTRTDIGDYLGMTIETVSRTISALRKKGYISLRTNRSIEINRMEGLRQLCC